MPMTLSSILTKVEHIQPQLNKLRQYEDWAHMDLGISKYVVTGCPNISKLQPLIFTTHLKGSKH